MFEACDLLVTDRRPVVNERLVTAFGNPKTQQPLDLQPTRPVY